MDWRKSDRDFGFLQYCISTSITGNENPDFGRRNVGVARRLDYQGSEGRVLPVQAEYICSDVRAGREAGRKDDRSILQNNRAVGA